MADSVKVQVRFSKRTAQGVEFNDALYFTQEEYAALSPEQLEAMKQARFDNWQEIVITASNRPPVVPTRQELEQRRAELELHRQSVVSEINELDRQISGGR